MNHTPYAEHRSGRATRADDRHLNVRRLLTVAGVLGILAGIIQAAFGTRIPGWTGAKAEPVSLGLLTITLSLLVIGSAWLWQAPARLAPPLVAVVAALVGFTTVGRLWYLPGPLIIAATVIGIRDWRSARTQVGRAWSQLLLAGLGGCDLILAAGAAPALAVLGAASGTALITAAILGSNHLQWTATLLACGTIPFAAVAWTALAPALTLVLVAALARPVIRGPRPASDHDPRPLVV
jgi:hypothetical protein